MSKPGSRPAPERLYLPLAFLWMVVLFGLSAIPDHGSGLGHRVLFLKPKVHNLMHLPAYGLLCWLWVGALRVRGWGLARAVAVAFLVAVVFGALDELHQYFVPGRFLSLTDALLNASGAGLVALWSLLRGA